MVERHVEKFQKTWAKATPAQQKFLTRMVFESLVMTPDGIDVFYWTTENSAANSLDRTNKKTPGSSPGVIYDLNEFRKASASFPSSLSAGPIGVAGASTDKYGGSGRSRTGTPVRILDFESSASTNSTTEPRNEFQPYARVFQTSIIKFLCGVFYPSYPNASDQRLNTFKLSLGNPSILRGTVLGYFFANPSSMQKCLWRCRSECQSPI